MRWGFAFALLLAGCASSAAPGAGPVVVMIGADAGAPPGVTVDSGDGATAATRARTGGSRG
jgi:hypothetical protein